MSVKFFGLSKTFANGKKVLDNLSFELPHGKFSGLLGPSGCGKTTLLRILAGLEQATEGRVEVEGEVWSDTARRLTVAPERRNVGMVFQSYAVWPHLTVGENIAFPLRVRKVARDQRINDVREHLRIVGLEGFEDRYPDSLSGGQQQRVALARALIQRPKLLLLDEPLSNLDAGLRAAMRQEIRRIQTTLHITSVIVTHDREDAATMCDTVVELRDGKMVPGAYS